MIRAYLSKMTGLSMAQTARLMVGIPDYDTYVAHRRANHPGQPIMSYTEFFRERQQARMGQRRDQADRAPEAEPHRPSPDAQDDVEAPGQITRLLIVSRLVLPGHYYASGT